MVKYGALTRSSEFMRPCNNMDFIVQTTGGDEYSLNGKSEIRNKTLDNITGALMMNSSHNKNFGSHPISMIYGYNSKMIIGSLVMFHTYYGMGKY